MTGFALFVDGSNLFGSLKDMKVQVDDYQAFYKHIFEQSVESWKEATIAT